MYIQISNSPIQKLYIHLYLKQNEKHPQRESNLQLTLRRGLLYPFNYEGKKIVNVKVFIYYTYFIIKIIMGKVNEYMEYFMGISYTKGIC